MKIKVGNVTLKLVKDIEWEEYVVQYIQNGKVDENKSYYSGGLDTDSKDDAIMTMNAIARRI